MSATKANSVLDALEIDVAIIDSLSEPVLSDLIGFIEDEGRSRPREWEATATLRASGDSFDQ